MQQAAEAAAREKEQAAGDNYEVAMVAIDPDNGYIKALVGGKDYDASQVNMATGTGGQVLRSRRSPWWQLSSRASTPIP